MNSTFEIARDLGWDYFVKLAAQNAMPVQSATDTPKKISLGDRAVMVDGAGYLVISYEEPCQPVDMVNPEEGTPLAGGPSAVFKAPSQSECCPGARAWTEGERSAFLRINYAGPVDLLPYSG